MKAHVVKFHPHIRDKIFDSKEEAMAFINNDEAYQEHVRKNSSHSISHHSVEVE